MSGDVSWGRCEVCWFGGPDIRREHFRAVDEVTLCVSCTDTDTTTPVVAGSHRVAFSPTGESWVCSCGQVYRPPVFLGRRVVAAIPNPVAVTARLHVQAHAGLSMAGGR